jgi:hypothetical protein
MVKSFLEVVGVLSLLLPEALSVGAERASFLEPETECFNSRMRTRPPLMVVLLR